MTPTETLRSLKPRLETWVLKLLTQTKAAFPRASEMNELEAQAHLEAWNDIIRHSSRERFEVAIRRCIAELTFFPKREEIEARIPSLDRLVGRADENCKDCGGTGWTRVHAGKSIGWVSECQRRRSDLSPKCSGVMRCACWRKVADA